MSEPKSTTGTRLSEVMAISHESVNRFLLRESYEPKDLFNQAKSALNLEGGTLSVDDSTGDKPYSQHMALVGHFWSGKHPRVVKGINLITRYYTDIHGQPLPVNYRLYDQSEGQTKNDYGKDMLAEVLFWFPRAGVGMLLGRTGVPLGQLDAGASRRKLRIFSWATTRDCPYPSRCYVGAILHGCP